MANNPTPATLGAAVVTEAARVYVQLAANERGAKAKPEHLNTAAELWGSYAPLRAALEVAYRAGAAAHADLLAQAHAAGAAEGAKAERERIAASLRTAADLHRIAAEDCLKATLAGGGAEFIAMWDRQHVNSLAAATALEDHAAAIARAGTSEANRG